MYNMITVSYSLKIAFTKSIGSFCYKTVQTVQTVLMQKRYSYMIPISTILLVYNLIGLFNDYYKIYSLYSLTKNL